MLPHMLLCGASPIKLPLTDWKKRASTGHPGAFQQPCLMTGSKFDGDLLVRPHVHLAGTGWTDCHGALASWGVCETVDETQCHWVGGGAIQAEGHTAEDLCVGRHEVELYGGARTEVWVKEQVVLC